MSKPTLREAMVVLANAANNIGLGKEDREDLINEWINTHRTLKQEIMRSFIMPLLNQMDNAYEQKYYDARNEASCILAHKMLHNDKVGERDVYLPFI
jgi:hypothetical protein